MADSIVLKNINKIYGEVIQTQVLFDLSLILEEGSFNAIIGQSGSGKSTLLNLMGTLDQPTSGEIYVGGQRTDGMQSKALAALRNRQIGFIFQFHYLLNEFTALENVLIPYQIYKAKPSKEILERAHYLLDLVGLTKVKQNRANNMSGGQQQRTAIARALMNQPKIILADEPTGNLDSETSAAIFEIFRQIHETEKTTFILVTHDDRMAQKADRIIEMKDGKIFMDVRTSS